MAATEEWKAAAAHVRSVTRVKRRLEERLERGLEGAPLTRKIRGLTSLQGWAKRMGRRAVVAESLRGAVSRLDVLKLRRGLLRMATAWLDVLQARRLAAMSGKRLGERRRVAVCHAYLRWKEEVAWRVERQNWVRCQVRYMHELQHMCDSGNGQRLARRLGNIGVEPHNARSAQQNLNVIRRSSALYLRELERELKRVGGPGRLVLEQRLKKHSS